ncbi:hypothetical protein [Shouchella lehensis]|uniref:Uncharacterized protein n=1 Tax=Shouchella lehensis TaxID=300825 RepID=A0A4Y7WDU8_9BACI|nr:hypothetical protein [Shouchella lehensis]MBG9783601.1 hypothetical protein [Shouchella lehensis]TES45641.1 hypothetical protein E2L03_19855 [Shouchella lehensis]
MTKRVSAHWDFENNFGTIIIHDKATVYESFKSPTKNISEFNGWVEDQKKLLNLLKEENEYRYI